MEQHHHEAASSLLNGSSLVEMLSIQKKRNLTTIYLKVFNILLRIFNSILNYKMARVGNTVSVISYINVCYSMSDLNARRPFLMPKSVDVMLLLQQG